MGGDVDSSFGLAGAPVQNVFRDMLAAVSSPGEAHHDPYGASTVQGRQDPGQVEFMVEGIVTLLGTVSKAEK